MAAAAAAMVAAADGKEKGPRIDGVALAANECVVAEGRWRDGTDVARGGRAGE